MYARKLSNTFVQSTEFFDSLEYLTLLHKYFQNPVFLQKIIMNNVIQGFEHFLPVTDREYMHVKKCSFCSEKKSR